jgi:choline dehydrogenase-like flavoprotein
MLGGSSSVWSGWCTIPRELDFDNPAVGVRWPIDRSELFPYWKKAAPILDHDPSFIDFETPLAEGFVYRPVPVAAPTRFADKYLAALKSSTLVHLALGRSIVALDANDSRSAVTRIDYVDHGLEARRTLVTRPGQSVVLAAGGIGNAQLLLQPRANGSVPVGNESRQVGRFLMEHPHLGRAGECVLEAELDRYWPAANAGGGVHARSVPTPR